jgi:phosphate transport system permease protein
MTQFIKIGGGGIILAVFGIFIFIFMQVLPLFQGADVTQLRSVSLPVGDYRLLGVDEWGRLPFVITAHGDIFFVDLDGRRGLMPGGLQLGAEVTAFSYQPKKQMIILGTRDGRFAMAQINYKSKADEHGELTVDGQVVADELKPIGAAGMPILAIAAGGDLESGLIASLQDVKGAPHLMVQVSAQAQGLLGSVGAGTRQAFDLSSQLEGKPTKIIVSDEGDRLLVAEASGRVVVFSRQGETLKKEQVLAPFTKSAKPEIARMDFLLGGVTVAFSSAGGEQVLYSLAVTPDGRRFAQTKQFPSMPSAVNVLAISLRNKAFATASGKHLALRYATTETTRWEATLPVEVSAIALNAKYNRLFVLDKQAKLTAYGINDPHPEAGIKAFFAKIWYEGSAAPKYDWQSTGGSDDFEPKLSLVPLIIGTLKGTFYAILFSVPIALLAAIYTALFLPREVKAIVKPMMEIMASLPSVVLGFLAALWLAPLLETRIPSLMLITFLIPTTAFGFGWLWSVMPVSLRVKIKYGREVFALIPILLFVTWVGWHAGPVLEHFLFVITDPNTGKSVADFRLWWPHVMGAPFEQRNSLVVGFMMGFAVIPIIYTISEDAMANVPKSLSSASLALGASRWQTAIRVILPTASAGIFSAIMIGLGRAIGETMIVVMATGNTPIMEFSMFSGMRTLSANIAVELPEAPVHGTLYRTLFLGALVLFILTFLLNTIAEVLRQHLREKYKTV